MKFKGPRLVEVEWDDAQSYGSSAWASYDNDTKPLLGEAVLCKTAGYLLPETNKKVIVIAGSLGIGSDHEKIFQISGHMTIPRGMVRAVRYLK